MLKLVELPNISDIKITSSGYKYNEPDINVTCNFKGTEPSPKGFGLCARMVLEGDKAKGTDDNIWVKKGVRWVKDKTIDYFFEPNNVVHDISKVKVNDTNKDFLKQAKVINDNIYVTWNKISKISKKIYDNKNRIEYHPDYDGLGGWAYPTKDKYSALKKCILNAKPKRECNKIMKLLKEDLSLMEKTLNRSIKLERITYNKSVKIKGKSKVKNKKTNSDALKIHDEIYKTWNKVAKKSKKKYDNEEYFIHHPDGIVNIKYLDWEKCIGESKPKRECNKLITMLKQDLKKMNKALEKVNKPVKVAKKTPVKAAKKTPVKAAKKTPVKVAKKTPVKVAKKTPVKVAKTESILWDVKTQGVMLAHTFKDPKSGKIKSPPKGYPKAPDGWYLSEKYDGYRAIWNGKDFVSRNGNIFSTPDWFKAWLPNNVALDGELFIGRESFEKHGLLREKIVNDAKWKKTNVKYQIFDSPTLKGDFEIRQKKIKKIISDSCNKNKGTCPLKYTTQKKIKNESEVYTEFNKLVKKGAEGVMLRSPKSPYETKRSSHLLKVKQLFDDECKIIGYKKGTGKYENMLGAFQCQLVKNPKIKFTISGMNDIIRKNYLKTHPLGTIVTFNYMGLSINGVPRHPNYYRIKK